MVIFKTLAEWRKGLGLSHEHRQSFSGCDLHSTPAGLTLQTRTATRILFYGVGIIRRDAIEYTIGDEHTETSGSYLLFLLSPLHVFRFRQLRRLEGWCFFAEEEWMHECLETPALQPFYEAGNTRIIGEKSAQPFLQLGRLIQEELQRKRPSSEKIIRHYLQIFLLEAATIPSTTGEMQDHSDDRLLRRFYHVVRTSRPMIRTVEEAAKRLSVTPVKLWVVVNRLTGEPPSALIHRCIMSEARLMLLQTDLGISEIGFRLDFKEKSHFSRFFKQHTGMTPTEYRQKKPGV